MVKIINTLLFVGMFFFLYKLVCRLLPAANDSAILMALLVTSVYPAFLIFNALALSENAFIFLFVLSAWVSLRLREPSLIPWLGFGLCVGLLFAVHPKSLPVVISSFMVGAYIAFDEKKPRSFLAFFAVASSCVWVSMTLNAFVRESLVIGSLDPQAHYQSVPLLLERLFTLQGVMGVIGNFAGQLLYLITATIGVLIFGVLTAIQKIRSGDPDRHVWAFLLLSLAGTVAMSTLALDSAAGGARLDHLYYGRYNEGVMAPLLLTGFLSVTRRVRPWLVVLLGVVKMACARSLPTLLWSISKAATKLMLLI